MATLQKVNLGTPPTAVDGDTVRGANTKANANVDVLNAQTALTSAAATITNTQALTAAHVGKRVNINLPAAGTINLPSAATMGLDGVVHLRNVGATLVTLAIAAGSGDTIALTKLRAGESAVMDSDGVHAIGCLMSSCLTVGRSLVKTITASAVSNVVLTDADFGGFDSITIELVAMDFSTADASLRYTMAPNADGSGATGYTTAYFTLLHYAYSNDSTTGGATSAALRGAAYGNLMYVPVLGKRILNATGEVTFSNMLGLRGLGPQCFGRCFAFDSSAAMLNGSFAGFVQVAVGVVKYVNLFTAAGTFNGKILVYGNNS